MMFWLGRKPMDMKQMKRFIGLWVIGGIATVAILATLTGLTAKDHGWFGYLQLVRHGATCEATVTRTEPQNHCRAEYSFTTGDRSYSGTGPDCSAKVGQNVTVTYLASDPSHSCLWSAHERLTNEVMTFLMGGIGFPPFVMLAYRMRKKEKLK
jgi:hypothetical protein